LAALWQFIDDAAAIKIGVSLEGEMRGRGPLAGFVGGDRRPDGHGIEENTGTADDFENFKILQIISLRISVTIGMVEGPKKKEGDVRDEIQQRCCPRGTGSPGQVQDGGRR
jgi:hypothetical protein